MSENMNERMQKSMEELRAKHAAGTNEIDDSDRAPTGAAYREVNRIHAERAKAHRARADQKEREGMEEVERIKDLRERVRRDMVGGEGRDDGTDGDGSDGSSGDEWDDLLEEDPELEAIRSRRAAELRAAQSDRAANLAKGHGEVRTIGQDDFLTECTGSSEWVAIHFFHDEFERCKILDHHLKIVAPLHVECKILRIDARKAPFFVSKLQVRTLPTLLVFQDGKAVDRLTGFDKLAVDPKDPDCWHTGKLREWLAGTGAVKYTIPTDEVLEEMRKMGVVPRGTVWSGAKGVGSSRYDDDEEEE